jgi:hypothetical protein
MGLLSMAVGPAPNPPRPPNPAKKKKKKKKKKDKKMSTSVLGQRKAVSAREA